MKALRGRLDPHQATIGLRVRARKSETIRRKFAKAIDTRGLYFSYPAQKVPRRHKQLNGRRYALMLHCANDKQECVRESVIDDRGGRQHTSARQYGGLRLFSSAASMRNLGMSGRREDHRRRRGALSRARFDRAAECHNCKYVQWCCVPRRECGFRQREG
jgi:hypothetical protein